LLVVSCSDLCTGMDSEADAKPQIDDITPEAPAYRHIGISHRAFSTRAPYFPNIPHAVRLWHSWLTPLQPLPASSQQADLYRVSTQCSH